VLKAGCANGGRFRESENKALPADVPPQPEFEIRAGDLIMSRANTRDLLGSVAYVACCRPRLLLCDKLYRLQLRHGAAVPRFLAYALSSDPIRYQLERSATGASDSMQNVGQDVVRGLQVACPAIALQNDVADFLDTKTAVIDALIAKKDRLIELLQEKRQALIMQAVTKGLDPSVPMKDSGVESLGVVPKHWRAVRLMHLVSVVTSGSRGWSEFFAETGALFLQSGNLDRTMSLDLTEQQHVTVPAGTEGARTSVCEGDILVCITGGLTGNVAWVSAPIGEAYVNQHLALVRPSPRLVHPEFAALVLHGAPGQQQLTVAQYGLKQGLALDDVKNVWLPIPPLDEQVAVARALREKLTAIGRLVATATLTVHRLREYRQALITAAVTGQLDIPQEAAPAPELVVRELAEAAP
jgi:type I restriction enzyme, S subunit